MQLEMFIPIVLFICIFLAIKVVVDARVRRRLVETNGSEELVKVMLAADEEARRGNALKWGLVSVAIGGAFFMQQMFKLDENDPATFGLLFVAAGAALLHALHQQGQSESGAAQAFEAANAALTAADAACEHDFDQTFGFELAKAQIARRINQLADSTSVAILATLPGRTDLIDAIFS